NLRVVFTKAQLKSKSKLENECHSAQNTDLRLQIRLAPSLTDLRENDDKVCCFLISKEYNDRSL
ncbi:TPA: hypothetical protein ACL8GM_001884, partial [Streptococcus pneumoniae]